MFEKFLELFLSDEIVLLIVEHGHEDVEVRQQLGKATLALENDREIAARPPFWKTILRRLPGAPATESKSSFYG